MTHADRRSTGLYGQFRKALEIGKAPWSQPWERDASIPSTRDLAMRAPIDTVPHADLSGPGLEYEEIEAEADNAEPQEVSA